MTAATHARTRIRSRLVTRLLGLRGQPVPPADAEGQVAACRKCLLAIQVLGGTWTCIEDDRHLYGETNCGADLSAAYTPHEPMTGRDGRYVLPVELADAARAVLEPPVQEPPPAHPPWETWPQPALAGPGTLGALYAAADLRGQRDQLASEYEAFYGWPAPLRSPEGLARPYAPEPAPEPESVPVSYPPLDLRADLGKCVIFRDTVRNQFVRQEYARGNRLAGPWLPAYADLFERRTGRVAP